MTKSVYIAARIILAGVDVSDIVTRWCLDMKVGHLDEVILEFNHDPSIITVMEQVKGAGRYMQTQEAHGMVRIKGFDITNWVTAMEFLRKPGEMHGLRLALAADPKILEINGGYPWLPRDQYPKVNLFKPGLGTVTYALS